jgi:hypothetical protein
MVARPPNGGCAHQRGAQDGASGTLLPLALGRSSADELSRLLTAAWKNVTPHVSKPHDYVNHMFMRL